MTNRQLRWYETGSFTPEQTLERIWDVEDCKALISRFMIYFSNEMQREILDELWVSEDANRETASFASNWGYYEGYAEVERYFIQEHGRQRATQLSAYNDEPGSSDRNLGHGLSVSRMVDTPVIYIAEDGKTAQGMFFQTGEETIGKPGNEADGWWFYGRVAVDFIREKNGWRIWHYVDSLEMECPVGYPMRDMPLFPKPEDEFFRHAFEDGNPTIPFLTHDYRFHLADGWPQFPSAHKTYNVENSYASEHHPEKRGDCVDIEWETVKCARYAWNR